MVFATSRCGTTRMKSSGLGELKGCLSVSRYWLVARLLVVEDFSKIAHIHHLPACRAFEEVIGFVFGITSDPLAIQPADGASAL